MFGSMGFDCFMGSVNWTEDGFLIQQFQNLENQSLQPLPLVDPVDNLAASSSSSSSSSFSCCGSLPQEFMQSLFSEMQNQNVEMDLFLQLQSNTLRRAILQEETRQRAVTMQKCESRMKYLMLKKDEELAIARNSATELQNLIKAAEMEAATWERMAREKEATAAELSHRLNQVRERTGDAASFSGGGERNRKKMDCKVCHAGLCCVVFFPCRHICCCRSCEPLLEHCPVCQTVKEARLQVFFA